jgi:hypothetical protein
LSAGLPLRHGRYSAAVLVGGAIMLLTVTADIINPIRLGQ